MKTLYVSDLDGTLLQSNQKTSDYTNSIIKELCEKGMLFSYATARSYYSAKPVTEGLDVRIPLILYNGTFIMDSATQEILISYSFTPDERQYLRNIFEKYQFIPIVYSLVEGKEKFHYLKTSSKQQLNFIATRHDERKTLVSNLNELYQGEFFYISAIADKKTLEPIYQEVKNHFQTIFSEDIYSGDTWLEILPQQATKANAVLKLKDYLKADRLVVFGDGKNDLSMFEVADECYAVQNACDELKAVATALIGHHNDDAVVKFLKDDFQC